MNQDKIIILLLVIIVGLLVVGLVLFNPFKTDSMISITSSAELNEGDDFSIALRDAEGAPIAHQSVNVIFTTSNGVAEQKSLTTDDMGNGVISLAGLASGQYNVNATYGGNDSFKPSHTSQNLNIKQPVTKPVGSTDYLPSDTSIHPGFTPSYREGNIVYGYKGERFGFVTPSGMFHEM